MAYMMFHIVAAAGAAERDAPQETKMHKDRVTEILYYDVGMPLKCHTSHK